MATMQAIGFADSAAATREARKYIAAESPDFTLSDVTTFYDDKDTLSWGWRAVWGEDAEEGEPVEDGVVQDGPVEADPYPSADEVLAQIEDGSTADPLPVAHVSPEIAEAFGMGGMVSTGLVVIEGGKVDAAPEYADPLTAPMDAPQAGDVFLRVGGSMSRTEAAMLANMISGKLAGVTLQVVDVVSGNVVQTFEGKTARKAGTARAASAAGDARDWTVKPIVTGTNAGAQARLDRIEAGRFNVRAIRAELDKISPTSVQTYSVQARKYAAALLREAEVEEAKYGGSMDHLLAAD